MEKYIYFNSRDVFFRVELLRIAYFEADKNYTTMYLSNGDKLVFTFGLGTMKEYLEKNLKGDAQNFARIGKSFIINLHYVYQINLLKQTLQLYIPSTDRSFTLSVSKEALKGVKALFAKK